VFLFTNMDGPTGILVKPSVDPQAGLPSCWVVMVHGVVLEPQLQRPSPPFFSSFRVPSSMDPLAANGLALGPQVGTGRKGGAEGSQDGTGAST
jgi:hypothetical protein